MNYLSFSWSLIYSLLSFLLQPCSYFVDCQLQHCLVLLWFPLPYVVITLDDPCVYWTFYFQVSRLPLSFYRIWSGSISNVSIALEELQAVVVLLCRMVFCLSGKVVPLYLDNSTAKVYLCNEGDSVSVMLYIIACDSLNLAEKHSITLILSYLHTYVDVEANSQFEGEWFKNGWHCLPHIAQVVFPLCSQLEVDLLASSHTNQCQHYYIFDNLLYLGTLGLNTLIHPWKNWVSYVFVSHVVHLVLSRFLADHNTGLFRLVIFIVPCYMQAPWLFPVLNLYSRHSFWCPVIRDHVRDVLINQLLRGVSSLHLTLWLLGVLHRQGFLLCNIK